MKLKNIVNRKRLLSIVGVVLLSILQGHMAPMLMVLMVVGFRSIYLGEPLALNLPEAFRFVDQAIISGILSQSWIFATFAIGVCITYLGLSSLILAWGMRIEGGVVNELRVDVMRHILRQDRRGENTTPVGEYIQLLTTQISRLSNTLVTLTNITRSVAVITIALIGLSSVVGLHIVTIILMLIAVATISSPLVRQGVRLSNAMAIDSRHITGYIGNVIGQRRLIKQTKTEQQFLKKLYAWLRFNLNQNIVWQLRTQSFKMGIFFLLIGTFFLFGYIFEDKILQSSLFIDGKSAFVIFYVLFILQCKVLFENYVNLRYVVGHWRHIYDYYENLRRLSSLAITDDIQGGKASPDVGVAPVCLKIKVGESSSDPSDFRLGFSRRELIFLGGEFWRVLGESGAGKSTFFSLLSGEHQQKGVLVNFTAPSASIDFLLVDEHSRPFGRTLRECFDFFIPGLTDLELYEISRRFRFEDFISSADDINRDIGESGSMLSHGQRKRLVVALALQLRPSVLILDEALDSSDGPRAAHVEAEIVRMRSSAQFITFYTSHNKVPDPGVFKNIYVSDFKVDVEQVF